MYNRAVPKPGTNLSLPFEEDEYDID
jgi:hypothetical protein